MMKRQRGLGAIMAIVVLVILASLAAAMAKLGTQQQLTSAQDVLSSRAWAAARAGNEWGLFRALSTTTPADAWKTCSNQTQTLDLTAATGFRVTVTCDSIKYYEGECDAADTSAACVVHPSDPARMVREVRLYRIESTACNSSVSCPDAGKATSQGYIERKRQVVATN